MNKRCAPGKKIVVAHVFVAITIAFAFLYQEEILGSAWIRAVYYKMARQYDRAKYEISGEYNPGYYVPGHGTIITSRFTPDSDITIVGTAEFEAIYFADDIGAQVSRIDNRGNVLWRFQGTDKTRSLFRHKNQIGFVDGEQIKFLDAKSGMLTNTINPGIGRISCAHAPPPPPHIFLCGNSPQSNNIWQMELAHKTQDPKNLKFITASSARDIDVRPDLLVVADSFGHKVNLYDRQNGSILSSIEEYFPSKVQFLSDTSVLVLGEHSNRLSVWDFKEDSTRFIFGYDSGSLKTNFKVDQWIESEKSLVFHANRNAVTSSPSKASTFFSGSKTLYSPNSFVIFNHSIFIADTDNHRIVEINKTGDIQTLITGINNPVSLIVE